MDNAFFQMCKSIDRMETEWSKTKTGKAPTASVINLWREGQRMHAFLRSYRSDIAKEYNEIASRFTGSYLMKQKKEYEDLISHANEAVVSGYRKDIQTFVNDKEDRLDGMLTTPPSESQRALLESLKLRVSNLSRAEAQRILPAFLGNYSSLKAFEAICKDAGYKLYTPLPDAMELFGALDQFAQYMDRICNQIGKADPDYLAKSFFFDPDDPNYIEPAVARFSEAFDTVPQLQNYSADMMTAGEEAKIDSLFRGIEQLNPEKISDLIKISSMTEKILRDNKNDVGLIMRSKYRKYAMLAMDLERSKLEGMAADNAEKVNTQLHGNNEAPLRT